MHVGMVILQNEKDQGIGQIDEKGHFTMYQFKPGDGLKPGVYRGYITNADELDQKGNPVSVINLKYTDIEQSGIIYDSSKDNGTLNIVVEKAAPPKK